MKLVVYLSVISNILALRKTRRMFNNIANYSAELVRTFIIKSEIAHARLGPSVRRR